VVANALSAALWTALVGGGGYLVGPSIGDFAADAGLVGLIVLGALALLGAARLLLHRHA
jgi:membrane protein DedA with SNARE-associated domain